MGHGECRWVGGRLYRADGQEVLSAPRLPKLGADGKLKEAGGWKVGQPGRDTPGEIGEVLRKALSRAENRIARR